MPKVSKQAIVAGRIAKVLGVTIEGIQGCTYQELRNLVRNEARQLVDDIGDLLKENPKPGRPMPVSTGGVNVTQEPHNYFQEALELLVGKPCPIQVPRFGTEGLSDKDVSSLQDWCSSNARPRWATGLSMMEAAELIVEGALENANIKGPDQE